MLEFIEAAGKHTFLQYALLTGLLAGIACGVVGTYVVTRRITYMAGAIAHCVLGGIGAAKYLSTVHGWTFITPMVGAVTTALFAAIVIGLVSLHARQREDTVIGALWAVGMGVGILFFTRTPGYNQDLMSFLFGNILMVTRADLYWIFGLDVIIVTLGLMFYNQFQAVCFDDEFARIRGVNVDFFYLLLLCLTALTVVVLVTVVGIVMVIALITLPVAVAGQFSKTLKQMMVLSAILSVVLTTSGLAISYSPDLPAGATIIALSAAVYFLTLLGFKIKERVFKH